jgi:protein TonB
MQQQPQNRTSGGGRTAVVIVIVLFVLLFFVGIVAMVYFRLGSLAPPFSPPAAQSSDFPPIPDYAPPDYPSADYPPPPVVDGPPPVVPPPPLVPNAQVTPRGSLASLVSPDDYPAVALREGRSGTTSFSMTIGPDGRAKDCRISQSSGSADLDNATCRIMRVRARFNPATDAVGEPTVGTYSNRIRWALP